MERAIELITPISTRRQRRPPFQLDDAVYVLHCFQKKTQETSEKDIKLARKRFKDLMKEQP